MRTQNEYKNYYLDKLIKMFPGHTQADYNSAQEFCYNEEWDLKDTDSIEGLNDAWRTYKKRFDDGFEVMNGRCVISGYKRNGKSTNKIFSSSVENASNYMREFIKSYSSKFKSGLDYYYRSKTSPHFDSIKIYYDDGTSLELADLNRGLCANVSLWKYDTSPWRLDMDFAWKSFISINFKDVYLTGDLKNDMELVENTLNEISVEHPNARDDFEESKYEIEKYSHKLNENSELIGSSKENNMKSKTQEVFDKAILKAAELVKFLNEDTEWFDVNDESDPNTRKLNQMNEDIS